MSGHSKWATIKRKKGALDAKRGQMFTKLIREIQVAAKIGGGDESANPRLRAAIQAAKAQNMPLANVERAIAKGTGDLDGATYEEITYEGYAPGGVALLIEVLTDNKNRTVSEIRHILSKHGGNLATTGSVAYLFENKGTIYIDKTACTEDDLLLVATDAGAEDIQSEGDQYVITVEPASFEAVKAALEAQHLPVGEAAVAKVARTTVPVDANQAPKILNIMEALEDHEDIQHVYANFDIDDEILRQLQGD